MAMKRVGVAELKDQLSKHLRAVEAGEEIEVTDRKRPIARIVPVRSNQKIRFIPPSRPFAEIRDKVYPPSNLGVDIVQILLEERGSR
jgi:prevent-host-death family protein